MLIDNNLYAELKGNLPNKNSDNKYKNDFALYNAYDSTGTTRLSVEMHPDSGLIDIIGVNPFLPGNPAIAMGFQRNDNKFGPILPLKTYQTMA